MRANVKELNPAWDLNFLAHVKRKYKTLRETEFSRKNSVSVARFLNMSQLLILNTSKESAILSNYVDKIYETRYTLKKSNPMKNGGNLSRFIMHVTRRFTL